MGSLKVLPNDVVQSLSVEVPFRSIDETSREIGNHELVNLGNNINPFSDALDLMKTIIAEEVCDIHNYSDRTSYKLINRLQEIFGLQEQNFIVSSGIDSILCLIVRTYLSRGDVAVTTQGTYPTFGYFANTVGVNMFYASYNEDFSVNLDEIILLTKKNKAKVIYLVNPDNPTGKAITKDRFTNFMYQVPKDVLVVLDEAYYDYLTDDLRIDDNHLYKNVIRLRTFSKGYGIAGMRVGYLIADEEITQELNKVRIQFEVNILGQRLACRLLDYNEVLKKNIMQTNANLKILSEGFSELSIETVPSYTNFICVNFKSNQRAERIQKMLLHEYGIFTRKPSVKELDSLVRISVGKKKDMMYLLSCIKQILSNELANPS